MKTSAGIVLGSPVAMLIATGSAVVAEGRARSTSWLRAGPGTSHPATAHAPRQTAACA
jgi:uncharacterized protein YraI